MEGDGRGRAIAWESKRRQQELEGPRLQLLYHHPQTFSKKRRGDLESERRRSQKIQANYNLKKKLASLNLRYPDLALSSAFFPSIFPLLFLSSYSILSSFHLISSNSFLFLLSLAIQSFEVWPSQKEDQVVQQLLLLALPSLSQSLLPLLDLNLSQCQIQITAI